MILKLFSYHEDLNFMSYEFQVDTSLSFVTVTGLILTSSITIYVVYLKHLMDDAANFYH